MRPVVLLDIDGVVCDYASAFVSEINRITGKSLDARDIDRWDIGEWAGICPEENDAVMAQVTSKGWCRDLRPYEGAVQGVERLRDLADVVVLTAPMHGKHWHAERVEWIRDHLGLQPEDVIFSKRKELVEGDVLIEDRAETVSHWLSVRRVRAATRHHKGVVVHRRHNAQVLVPLTHEQSIHRAFSWRDIVGIVEEVRQHGFK